MKRGNMWTLAVGGTAVLALALAGTTGCRGSATTGDTATGRSASVGPSSDSTTAATTTPAATTGEPSTNSSPVLADGRSAAYITGLDTTHNTVTFDLIEFLTGDAAQAAWKKEHPEDPNGLDNDYMIVNNNKTLRTLPVAASAQCVVLKTLGGTDTKTISFAAFPAFLTQQNKGMALTPPNLAVLPFWLTVQHGTVIKFEEQFLP
ncbi:hypothetical protein [Dactylosporangium sp. NPDC048998]|uniref:hypothetical protein n=1 Tax=Dactylosporangium sp. NPDC048998 TaxID=3363976 RepID=UPI003720400C